MAKMVKCKTCGADIAKNEKVCPSCGAKNKKSVLFPVIGAVVVIAVIGSMGGSDEPTKVGDVGTDSSSSFAQSSASTPSQPEKKTFGVGEVVELNNVSATMLSVSESKGEQFFTPTEGHTFVICEFEIENNSAGDIVVSSLMSFEAYFDDYSSNLDVTAMALSGKDQLDGTVAAGKKIKGVIGYQASEDWSNMELHFTPDVWAGKDIVFTYSK